MRTSYDIILGPVNTEKSNLQNELLNQVTFEVDPRANRIEIKKAVEEIFKVKVEGVRTAIVKGKKKASWSHCRSEEELEKSYSSIETRG